MSMTSFRNNIEEIGRELSLHHRTQEELKRLFIQERLSQSLRNYYSSVEQSFNYLSSRDTDNLLRKYKRVMND